MIKARFVIPGDLSLPTGGYRYDREVLARAKGIALVHMPIAGAFPHPTADDLRRARAALGAVKDGILLIDGLAYGAFSKDVLDAIGVPIIALVHHPLALEAGTAPARVEELKRSETEALARARAVVVTSAMTAATLVGDYGVPFDRVRVAEPGTERCLRATGSGGPDVAILAVGAVSERKAYHLLVEALGTCRDLPWRLTIAGKADAGSDAYRQLQHSIAGTGLGDRVQVAGAVDEPELERLYGSADLFVLSSLYEGYGMALAEAMAHGLAIVTTTGGAAATTVPAEAALKVPPGDVPALADALRRAIGDRALRGRLADAAWAAGQRLPTWDDTVALITEVIRKVAS